MSDFAADTEPTAALASSARDANNIARWMIGLGIAVLATSVGADAGQQSVEEVAEILATDLARLAEELAEEHAEAITAGEADFGDVTAQRVDRAATVAAGLAELATEERSAAEARAAERVAEQVAEHAELAELAAELADRRARDANTAVRDANTAVRDVNIAIRWGLGIGFTGVLGIFGSAFLLIRRVEQLTLNQKSMTTRMDEIAENQKALTEQVHEIVDLVTAAPASPRS